MLTRSPTHRLNSLSEIVTSMVLTARRVCDTFAQVENLELDIGVFTALLHPEAVWRTKWYTWYGSKAIETCLADQTRNRQQSGLHHVALASTHALNLARPINNVVCVEAKEPTKYAVQTVFRTSGGWITGITSYAAWVNPVWPEPQRALDKLAQLRSMGVPFAESAQPRQVLIW